MTVHPSLMRAYCIAGKRAEDRAHELLAGPNGCSADLGADPTLKTYREVAGRLWDKLPDHLKAAVNRP